MYRSDKHWLDKHKSQNNKIYLALITISQTPSVGQTSVRQMLVAQIPVGHMLLVKQISVRQASFGQKLLLQSK